MHVLRMVNMEYDINFDNIEDSNNFLRALWSQIRTVFGSCGWQFMPYRDGENNTIHFGHFSANELGVLSSRITYGKKGSIKKIIFEDVNDKEIILEERLKGLLDKCVSSAKDYKSLLTDYWLKTTIKSLYYPISNYQGEEFRIVPVGSHLFDLTIHIKAYDRVDAKSFINEKFNKVLDYLSVHTNNIYFYSNENDRLECSAMDKRNEVYSTDYEWIDYCPSEDAKFLLFEESKRVIDKMLLEETDEIEKYFTACRLFHSASKYMSLIFDYKKLDTTQVRQIDLPNNEVSMIQFMSALEVASEIGSSKPETCCECGQLKYSISRRVLDMVNKYCGKYSDRLFKAYYIDRSKYVHAGKFFSNNTYQGVSIPQLDINSSDGCVSQVSMKSLVMAKDLTSYCLRKFELENFKL